MILVWEKFAVLVVLRGKMSDDKNARSEHRSYVTRTIKKAKHIIRNFEETNRFRLERI